MPLASPVYQEGTWTPTDASGAALSITPTDCRWIKIGRVVIASFAITWPANANGSNARITGLPFTSKNGSVDYVGGGAPALTNTSTTMTIALLKNAVDFLLFNYAGGNVVNSALSGLVVRGTVTYEANA